MDVFDINTTGLADYTIMLVDDDKMIRDIIMQNLRGIGFQRFIQASNGLEAHEVFNSFKQDIHLILCDWDMPKADGLVFLRAVRAHPTRSETPFIMVTAQQTDERTKISQAAKFNVDAYIVKPFNAETLRKKVLSVLFGKKEKPTGS